MPVPGTSWSGTVWATGGRVLMQLRVVGAGERVRFPGWLAGASGHPTKSLRYSLGNVRSPAEVAIPRLHLDVVFAAISAVHAQQSVLTPSANNRPLITNKNGDPKAADLLG